MRKTICYVDERGENRFQIVPAADMTIEQIIENWKASHPGCQVVAAYANERDEIVRSDKDRFNYMMHCEELGLSPDDIDAEVRIRGQSYRLHSINTRKTKYKVVWQSVTDTGKGIRTTAAYAKNLLQDARVATA